MSPIDSELRLLQLLVEEFSETEFRLAVRHKFPNIWPKLPGVTSSPQHLADQFIQAAKRDGLIPEVAVAVLLPRSPRRRMRRLITLIWSVCAVAASLAGGLLYSVHESGACPGGDLGELEVPESAQAADCRLSAVHNSPEVALPEGRHLPPRRAPRKVKESRSNMQQSLEKALTPRTDFADEAKAGIAECGVNECILRADAGRFFGGEEFCILLPDGSVAGRCSLHGRLIDPTASIRCDIAKAGTIDPAKARRWGACDAAR